jgi:histidinol-phosphatase (PHP family)
VNNPPVDYHLHSTCSADGASSIDDHCQRASELGLAEIGFCEHADFDPRDRSYGYFDYADFRRQIETQRERIGHSLAVRAAVEVTYQASKEEEIARFLADKRLDYVVGSVHLVEDVASLTGGAAALTGDVASLTKGAAALTADWAMISEAARSRRYFEERTVQAAYGPYFAELRRAVASGLFDLIGHFDLVKRYGVRHYGPFDPAAFACEIHDILKLAVEKGVGLEINTSGLRQPPGETFPGLTILTWYRELGGEIVTVGSDAHAAADLGRDIAQAVALARQAGFRAIALFERRELRWMDIG